MGVFFNEGYKERSVGTAFGVTNDRLSVVGAGSREVYHVTKLVAPVSTSHPRLEFPVRRST